MGEILGQFIWSCVVCIGFILFVFVIVCAVVFGLQAIVMFFEAVGTTISDILSVFK